jgi:GT2 family glycosyltransferase
MRVLRRAAGQSRLPGLDPAIEKHGFFWVAGMFLLMRATAYREIGGFDERFFLYCEDYDVCARMRRAGYSIVLAPATLAVHDAQRGSLRSMRHLRWHVASLFRVWTSSAFWWVVWHGSRATVTPR